MANDPLILPPRLWFGLLCNGLGTDKVGRIDFREVFNQVAFVTPPEDSGIPSLAHLNAVLAIGFSDGLGHFDVDVDLRDIDEKVLWERPEGRWSFDLGPGERAAAVLAARAEYWFREPGQYHFRVHIVQTPDEYRIPFQVAEQIGPARLEPGSPQEGPQSTQ